MIRYLISALFILLAGYYVAIAFGKLPSYFDYFGVEGTPYKNGYNL